MDALPPQEDSPMVTEVHLQVLHLLKWMVAQFLSYFLKNWLVVKGDALPAQEHSPKVI